MSEITQEITQDRIVRFVMPPTSVRGGPTPSRTAIVSGPPAEDGTVTLHVLLHHGDPAAILERLGGKAYEGLVARIPGVKHDQETKAPGTWHWAERKPVALPTLTAEEIAEAKAKTRAEEKAWLRELLSEISDEEQTRYEHENEALLNPGTDPRESSDEHEPVAPPPAPDDVSPGSSTTDKKKGA